MLNENMMKSIQIFIENELENKIQKDFNIKKIEHNHPPLRFKVDDCEYCKKYGNVFQIN